MNRTTGIQQLAAAYEAREKHILVSSQWSAINDAPGLEAWIVMAPTYREDSKLCQHNEESHGALLGIPAS